MEYTQVNNSNDADYPFFKNALFYGGIAGGLIALSLFALQTVGMEQSIGGKYISYVMLGLVLAYGLIEYDAYLETGTTFKNGMVFAAQICLFSGATLILIHLVTFLTGSSLVFSKYGIEATKFSHWLLLSGGIFMEVMVAGLVFTFIILQALKSRKNYKQ